MKFNTFFILCFFLSSNLYSQRIIKNGVVDFEVASADVIANAGIIQDSLLIPTTLSYTHYFSSNSFLLENMNQDTTIRIRHHRSKNGHGSYFFNIKGQNYKFDDFSEKTYSGEKSIDRLDVKSIAGYNCHKEKFYISNTDYVEMYVTRNIKPGFNYYEQIFPDLKGFPLEIYIRKENKVYKYTTKSVNSLPDKFPLLPDLAEYKLLKEGQLKRKLQLLIGA